MKLKDKLEELATVENAKAYAAETDQFVFCLNLLDSEVSAWDDDADEIVNALEDKFDELNGGEVMKLMITDVPGQGVLVRFPEDLLEKYTPAIETLKENEYFETMDIFRSRRDGMLSFGVLFDDTVIDRVKVKRKITEAFGL